MTGQEEKVIYVCTVHYKTEDWIKPQSFFIKKNLDMPYRVFACVPHSRKAKEHYLEVNYEPGTTESHNHADKLNYLARLVCAEAMSTDIIVFLDGDAFPINPISSFLEDKLSKFKLLAVQRKENDGDIQPHPSFAATTVGFWTKINGDWNPGYTWKDIHGADVTDAGGILLKQLNENGEDWYAMLRTNHLNPHPLWFGIYDNLIYHHGAGYRDPVSRLDLNRTQSQKDEFLNSKQYDIYFRLHKNIFRAIKHDVNFYKRFM